MGKQTKYYSPLRYPGGKSCIFPFMSQFFYENRLIGISYAEPYAGGAGLALRLLVEEYVDHIYINDFDPSIYAFWDSILKYPDEFCEWIAKVDISVENWLKYKKVQQGYMTADSLELAKSTFFLNRTNVSGVIKGGIIGGVNQTGKYKIDARFNKDDLISRIQAIAKFAERIYVSNYDGIEFIKRLNRKKEDVFIYLDPPYYQKGSDLYMNYFTAKDHEALKDVVCKLHKRWLISYDNNDFILNLYPNYRKIVYQLSQCASNRVGDEVLIFDQNHCFDLSSNMLTKPLIHNACMI
jgi:DNA adenine methylase